MKLVASGMGTSRPEKENPFWHHPKAAWASFDAAFYAAANPAAGHLGGDEAALLEHYLAEGAAAGFSPNRWFDEEFYRVANPDLDKLIQDGGLISGFAHYCRTGFTNRAPHWLFDPAFYLASNPGLGGDVLTSNGFVNAYDHYLKHGAAEQRLCHPFFVPADYAAALDPDAASDCARIGAFKHFLCSAWNRLPSGQSEPRVSPHFDPAAYLAANPQAEEEIRAGLFHSALHHYLTSQARENPGAPPEVPPPATTGARRIKIHVDRPGHRNGEATEPIDGHLDIIGWAAADHPVASVEVYADGTYCGRAQHGIRTEGVAAAHPELSHAMFAGFRFVAPALPQPGRHVLRIVARGDTGLEASVEIAAEFKPTVLQDGPWLLRRRMHLSEAALKNRLLEKAGPRTVFVIVLPDFSGLAEARARTVKSLERQVYTGWRLHDPESTEAFGDAARVDCWFMQLSPGDELGVDALLELALYRLTHLETEFIYSDERRIDPALNAIAPYFKPDWSPDLLLATDYIGRLWAASSILLARAGLSGSELATGSNHDLVLRLTEAAAEIGHVSRVLCESAPLMADAPAVQRALVRRNLTARVESGRAPGTWRIRHGLPEPPAITVIIQTAGARNLIKSALRTLRDRTAYPLLEVIVVDTVPAVAAPWKGTMRDLAGRVIDDAAPFNWSRLNNRAAAASKGEILLFFNEEIALPDGVSDPEWLRRLAGCFQDPGVGVVGPQLLNHKGAVQHAGMFLDRRGGRCAFAGQAAAAPGPFGLALTQRNVSAVTGACMLVRRTVFDELNGFDERLTMGCSDTDFCLRCLQSGFRVLYSPDATLTHHAGASRASLQDDGNEALFGEIWRELLLAGDRYFNRQLALDFPDYRPDPEFLQTIYPARPLATADSIRRLLVIKLDHIGDFMLARPALRRLRQHFPTARITLLAAPVNCRLAALEAAIDDTIAFEFFSPQSVEGLIELPEHILSDLLQRLRDAQFDLAVDLRCQTETRAVLQASGATWLAGFDPAYRFPWLDIAGVFEADMERNPKRTHMADTLLDFAGKIGGCFDEPAVRQKPVLPWPASVPRGQAADIRIAVHLSTGNPMRQWPPRHFARLIDLLAANLPCWIVLVGSSRERDIAAAVLSAIEHGDRVVSAVGLTGPEEMVAVIAGCDLLIGNNSGPQHIAASLGVPVIGVHAGVVDAREWAPSGQSSVALSRKMVCSPCYLATPDDCPRALACLTGITPADVLRAVQELSGWHSGFSGLTG